MNLQLANRPTYILVVKRVFDTFFFFFFRGGVSPNELGICIFLLGTSTTNNNVFQVLPLAPNSSATRISVEYKLLFELNNGNAFVPKKSEELRIYFSYISFDPLCCVGCYLRSCNSLKFSLIRKKFFIKGTCSTRA